MSIQPRPLPEGVPNAADLYNGNRPQLPALAWTDERFQDILNWIEEWGAPMPTFRTETIQVADVTKSPDAGWKDALTDVLIRWQGPTRSGGAASVEIGAFELGLIPGAIALAIRNAFGLGDEDRYIEYPGVEARFPSKPNPIGGPWRDFQNAPELARLGIIFHPSASDNETDYPSGSPFSQVVDNITQRFIKVPYVAVQGLFGRGTKLGYYWQRVNYLD